MNPDGPFTEARRLGARHVATLAGLRFNDRRAGPCPACYASASSKRDARPPLMFRAEGRFRCVACGADGSGLDFALLVVGRNAYDPASAAAIEEILGRAPAAPPPPPPAKLEPLGLDRFRSLYPRRVCDLEEDGAPEVWAWLRRTFPAWPPELVAYAMPILSFPNHSVPSWLPLSKARTHRALFALFGLDGRIAGARFRATEEGAEPKTWSPKGYTTSGQVLATEEGAQALRRGSLGARDVVVVEGEKDLTAAAVAWGFHEDAPLIFGLASHPGPDVCRRLLGLTRRRLWLWVDPDDAGDAYVRAFARVAAPGTAVIPELQRSKDVADLAAAGQLPIRWDSWGARWASAKKEEG